MSFWRRNAGSTKTAPRSRCPPRGSGTRRCCLRGHACPPDVGITFAASRCPRNFELRTTVRKALAAETGIALGPLPQPRKQAALRHWSRARLSLWLGIQVEIRRWPTSRSRRRVARVRWCSSASAGRRRRCSGTAPALGGPRRRTRDIEVERAELGRVAAAHRWHQGLAARAAARRGHGCNEDSSPKLWISSRPRAGM